MDSEHNFNSSGEIIVPDMPYMREIFRILRTGAFICEDTLSDSVKRYYRKIAANFDAYFKYFDQLGYFLEHGPGYVHLCEDKTSQVVQNKIRTDSLSYIPMLALLVGFRADLAPGYQFKTYEFQSYCEQNEEIQTMLPSSDDGLMMTRVAAFLKGVAKEGFLDFSPDDSTCHVTSAFRYLKDYVTTIRLYGEHAKYNYDTPLDTSSETTEGASGKGDMDAGELLLMED